MKAWSHQNLKPKFANNIFNYLMDAMKYDHHHIKGYVGIKLKLKNLNIETINAGFIL